MSRSRAGAERAAKPVKSATRMNFFMASMLLHCKHALGRRRKPTSTVLLLLKICPGVAHDFVDFAVARLPAKGVAEPRRVCHQLGGIALAAGGGFNGNALCGDFFRGAQKLQDGLF